MKKALPAAFASVLLLALVAARRPATPFRGRRSDRARLLARLHGSGWRGAQRPRRRVQQVAGRGQDHAVGQALGDTPGLGSAALTPRRRGRSSWRSLPRTSRSSRRKARSSPSTTGTRATAPRTSSIPVPSIPASSTGERFGAPLSFTPLTMFYNRRDVRAAGVSVPTTWDEWVAARDPRSPSTRTETVSPEQYGLALQTMRPWATASGRLCSRAAVAMS